ncbi:hypothetical protein LGQ03_04960 [Loktanella sp. TSTF-M6]|uniref:Uncharacterized protein n=1 Tax=Loktanella gaetbuli TaxID=2881335 RepID=A0ABS8BS90_9RHOB|nr:hypothetical protein [Loktanella gaetbuli]MCB5198581.1 hypothetical protein [Loktanella gaetbuli]
MEWIAGGKELLGLIIGTITLLGVVGRWFWGRVSSRVQSDFSGLTSGHKDIVNRLELVEKDQGRLGEDLKKVETRLSAVENRMGSLATKSDLQALAVSIAKLEVTGAHTAQMVDTLYRGVLANAERGK